MQNSDIMIIGGTGLVGVTLSQALLRAGYRVKVLSRRPAPGIIPEPGLSYVQADVTEPGRWQELLPGCHAVINLAGASIFRRWSDRGRREILQSRIAATRHIVTALRIDRGNVRDFFSVSGVGYYGFHVDETLDETAPAGSDFLARVAARWEEEARPVTEAGIRLVICRLGHVLGRHGGLLPKLVTLARWHVAGRWGTGRQWLSWIHEDDLAACLSFLLEHRDIAGAVNITSPSPVRNREMMRLLVQITNHRALLPRLPEYLLRIIAGEFASVFVNGQRVLPRKLLDTGFSFSHPLPREALETLIDPYGRQRLSRR